MMRAWFQIPLWQRVIAALVLGVLTGWLWGPGAESIKIIGDIVAGSVQPEQEKLLSMAAELLQVDHALELMQKGQYLVADSETGEGQNVSSDFEMDNMLSAVVSAALDDIQKIKDAILDFIKDSTKEENIRFCENLLEETRGALKLLNEERAVHLPDRVSRKQH